MLRARRRPGARFDDPVFPSVEGGIRDPCNVRREFRAARGDDELSWVTTHTFRRTAATILDQAAIPARLVADQLGHSRPSVTQDFYLGRKGVDPQAAAALDEALSKARPNAR